MTSLKKFVTLALLAFVPLGASAAPIEYAFSPDGGATYLVVKAIGLARVRVEVAAYSFTSKPIAAALFYAHKRGVEVRIVVDKSNASARYTAATFLANEGVPVRVDYRYAIMHDKFIVIDGEAVELGSFNYTAAAEHRNAENAVLVHDPALAAQFEREWLRLWDESQPLNR